MKNFNSKILFTALFCAVFCSQSIYARVIYVDLHSQFISVANWNNLTPQQRTSAFNFANSWATAMPDLQFAMYYAANGDEIWVKATPASDPYIPMGYVPIFVNDINYFYIRNDVKVYGGFKGKETDLKERNSWFINQTHLSTTQHTTDYTLYMAGSNSLLDGFYIDFLSTNTAGIVMESGTADDNQVIANTVIKGNVHKIGGLYFPNKRFGIINVGGDNTVPSGCGAVLYNVVIYGFLLNTIHNLDENSIINVDGGNLDIWNVTIADNVSDPTNNNPKGIEGLAVTLGMGQIFGNIINKYPINVNIVNTIIWFRDWTSSYYGTKSQAIKLNDFGFGAIKVSYSDIMNSGGSGSNIGFWTVGVSDAGNNIDQKPNFLIDFNNLPSNLSHIWYQLDQTSPVIDMGLNDYPRCLPYFWIYEYFDLKNEYRIVNDIIDMGAFEWQDPMYKHSANIQQSPRRNDSQNNLQLQIFPNPVSGIAELQLGNLTSGKVFITDLQGKTLETFTITENRISLDVTNYQPGIYLVRILSDNTNVTEKLIVRK